MNVRHARVTGGKAETVARYLPDNYAVLVTHPNGTVIIQGMDVAGWTLDDYVIPRLASGNMGCREMKAGDDDE